MLHPLEEYSPSPICYLDEFIIEEKFEPIQTEFLTWIIEYLSAFSPILVINPVPSYFTVENDMKCINRHFDEDKILKSRRFFTRQLFYPLRDTDYMYHVHDYSIE